MKLNILVDTPEMQSQLVSAHGMLAILEVLEVKSSSRDVTTKLLRIINLVRLQCSIMISSYAFSHKLILLAGHYGRWIPRELLFDWVCTNASCLFPKLTWLTEVAYLL